MFIIEHPCIMSCMIIDHASLLVLSCSLPLALIIEKNKRFKDDYLLGELLRAELLSAPSADCRSLLCDASHTLEQGSRKHKNIKLFETQSEKVLQEK